MMRYQGLSPDNLPLSNGRRSHWRTCKEEDGIISSREFDDDSTKSFPTFAEGHKGIPRFRSPSSKTQDQNFSPYTSSVPNSPPHPKTNHHHRQHEMSNSPVHNGDVVLQWGHRKRSRLSRSIESRAAGGMTVTTDDSSSSSSTQIQAVINVKRRSISLPTPATVPVLEAKNAANANIMPPPSTLLPTTISRTAAANITSTSNGKGGSLKSCSKDASAFVNRRNSEERSAGGSGSHPPRNGGVSSRTGAAAGGAAAASSSRSKLGKRSPSKVIEKHDRKRSITATTTTPCSSASLRGDDKVNGCMQQEREGGGIGKNHHNIIGSAPLQEAGCSTNTTNHHDDNVNATTKIMGMAAEKAASGGGGGGGGEVNEWPRVYIPLTRKEKEEDFLVMKGTKLPHRPKKRPKAVDRMLQYCFPGMWLSDVTKARYEVKEKKSTTKKPKRRGLKGMESMESDSE